MDLNLNSPEQIKQLIAALQSLLPNDDNDEEEPKSKIKTKTRRSTKKKKDQNLFSSMPEKDMHKSDTLIDKKLNIHPPSARSRQFKPISVVCRVCGKNEKVNPAIVPEPKDRYKCNKCSSSAGG